MGKLYGNYMNRITEDHMYCDVITVGTGMTEYHYSDRSAYEVTQVRDQKHITVRKYDVVHSGPVAMDNRWELVRNENNRERDLIRIGDIWYWTDTVTAEDIAAIDNDPDETSRMRRKLSLAVNGYDIEKIMAKGKQTKRTRAHVSFGVADYYYDYSF